MTYEGVGPPSTWLPGKPNYIYALLDPETRQVRYIGKSIRPAERLGNHMNERGACHRTHWLQALKRRGLRPIQVILEQVWGEWPWQEAERFWIARGRALGWPLTNNTDGGDGVEGLPVETRQRMAAVWRGRKHSAESREKMSKAQLGRVQSAETRAKHSRAMKGRVISWGNKISQATRKLSADRVSEIERRLAAGEKVKDLAAEFGVHRTTLSKVTTGTYFGQLSLTSKVEAEPAPVG